MRSARPACDGERPLGHEHDVDGDEDGVHDGDPIAVRDRLTMGLQDAPDQEF